MNAAVILAAGASTRFGEESKLTTVFAGRSLLTHTVERALGCPQLHRAIVVVPPPPGDTELRGAAHKERVSFASPGRESALSASIAAGVAQLDRGIELCLIVLGDQPAPSTVYTELIEVAGDASREVIVPVYRGGRGNPVLFKASFFPKLLSLRGDLGARELLQDTPDSVLEVNLPYEVPPDLDTTDDIAALRDYLANSGGGPGAA